MFIALRGCHVPRTPRVTAGHTQRPTSLRFKNGPTSKPASKTPLGLKAARGFFFSLGCGRVQRPQKHPRATPCHPLPKSPCPADGPTPRSSTFLASGAAGRGLASKSGPRQTTGGTRRSNVGGKAACSALCVTRVCPETPGATARHIQRATSPRFKNGPASKTASRTPVQTITSRCKG